MNFRGEKTFQELLNEKMEQLKSPAEPTPMPQKDHLHSPSDTLTLLYSLRSKPFPKATFKGVKSSYYKTTPSQNNTWTPDHLPASLKTAFQFFRDNGEMVTDQSTERRLKSAFRRLARKLHPDMSHDKSPRSIARQNQLFYELKTHYQAILSFKTSAAA